MIIDYEDIKEKLDNIEIKKMPKTFLQIINKSHDEVIISKYLAYFLDERNTTRKIIKEILNATKRNKEPDFVELLENGVFESLKIEDSISQQNRLDIIIKYSTIWIVIENKVEAGESKENQTSIYENQINATNNNHPPIKYIYLKPNYNKSKPSNTNFVEFYYSDLTQILMEINKDELADRENYDFMQDFIKHSEEFLMKNSRINCDEQAIQFYLSNKKKIDYLIENYKSQSLQLQNILVERIKKEFPKFKVHDTASYIQIFKDTWENRGSRGLHFEILSNKRFDSLLENKSIRLRYAIHNEKNTKDKYDIESKTLDSQNYLFNNNENIEKSIKEIVDKLKDIINQNAHIIDEEIERKKNEKDGLF